MTKSIGQSMKSHPVPNELLRKRDQLLAELQSKVELTRALRQQLAEKEAYLLGLYEGNPDAAPSAEMLAGLIGL